jgi:cell division septal protein FtsQ
MGRLALVQSRSVRGDFTVPWRRVSAIAAAAAAVLTLLYLAARETPLFAVRTVEIRGGSEAVRKAVRQAAQAVEGESLVGLDGKSLVRELEALPSVRSASYDRAFPSTLRIFVRPELPLGVIRVGPDRWVVSERGRIIRRYVPEDADRDPRFRLPARPNVVPGSFVTDPPARVILGALALVPKNFPVRIQMVRLQGGRLTMELRAPWGRPELRLGEAVDVRVKLAAGALVLRSLSSEERASVAYVDVSVPERSVAGSNPQPEG